MSPAPRYPSLYQINTRVWLRQLSRETGKPVTLADIDDKTIDGFAERGFDWIWLLSVWQTGAAGRAVSRSNRQWRDEFKAVLPDLTEDDICGSGFAITGYIVSEALGGESGLAAFREKLAKRGIKLMLDFVPNHTAPDHPWVRSHPEYYVEADEKKFAEAPQNYLRVQTDKGPKILAYGRDPNYPGWPDTLQLNYANPALQTAQIDELLSVAGKCDGVRCDMAMLLLPEVFQRTWGITPEPFWPKATAVVRTRYLGFKFLAEVYWDLEWTLQQEGFDYCYDKRLYDRLKAGNARSAREHLLADLDYQDRLARFLENHDEPRAALEFPLPATPRSGDRHISLARIAILPPGSVRGGTRARTCPSLSRPGGAGGSECRHLLCEADLVVPEGARSSRRCVVFDRAAARMAWELELGLIHRWHMVGGGRRPRDRRRQLCGRSGPMPVTPAVRRASR